jgi:hypothetical protein
MSLNLKKNAQEKSGNRKDLMNVPNKAWVK